VSFDIILLYDIYYQKYMYTNKVYLYNLFTRQIQYFTCNGLIFVSALSAIDIFIHIVLDFLSNT